MAYRLRMPGQLGEWLTELAGSQPEAAAETGAALLALLHADAIAGSPLVAEPGEPPDPRETLDVSYQDMLERHQAIRHLAAEAAAIRQQVEDSLPPASADRAAQAEREHELAVARRREKTLTRLSSVLGQQISAFRAEKETAKALATAAEARLRVQDALAGLGLGADGEERADRAAAEQAAARSAARVARVQATADQALGRDDADADGDRGDVVELHADRLGADIRVLFAEEPPGTITLLAVLEGAAAVRQHRDEAVDVAADLLNQIRAGGWPPLTDEEQHAQGLEFDEAGAFLSRFFPGRERDVADRAAVLATARSLAGLREQLGVSAAELSRRIGASEEQVRAAERRALIRTDPAQLAAYVRGLGGTLYLTARFDGEQRRIL
jgi:DNA-binding transcriptional regulator YiaG